MNLETLLAARLSAAFEAVAGERIDPMMRRSQHADFQADGALPLARKLGRPPPDIAVEVLARADLADVAAAASVSGPGFINVTIAASTLNGLVAQAYADGRLGVAVTGQPESEKYFLTVYDLLDVTLTSADFCGESFYNPMLAPILRKLSDSGRLCDSEGAGCLFPVGFTGRDGEPMPLIVRKSDGGYGYGATDLAAIRYRTQGLMATRLLYVVGAPQRQHLEMVFQAAREADWLVAPARAVHVAFGQVLGRDGKKFASRSGETVKLVELLDEAVHRASAIVAEKNPELDAATQAEVARAVGIGAIKYADLSNDRIKDYVFDWDRMLATTGDTAAYLQYTYARIQSIFRRGGIGTSRPAAAVQIVAPAEHTLALELLEFPPVIDDVAQTLQFHKLTGYLQSLAGAYTAFHERCPVLRAPDAAIRGSRLVLCDLTGRVIRQGLALLGISTPERM